MLLEPPTMAWLLLGICTVSVLVFLFVAHRSDFKQKVPLFYCWLGAIAILGGATAFFLPIAVNSGFAKDDDGSALRQALLYTTGGLLGVITLGETHRKNNQEKEKNENDHIRQVHAERRSRYTKAVEQLANEKAAVRLGGIYTLVGLADEWLADDSLTKDKQKEEGQVIINNLCSYIRSSCPLAEKQNILELGDEPDGYSGDFTIERATLYEEQELRLSILAEIKKRLNRKVQFGLQGTLRIISGPWSNFDYNFSNTTFFYPVDFSLCNFGSSLLFTNSHFNKYSRFSASSYNGATQFSNTVFQEGAEFHLSKFKKPFHAHNAQFMHDTDFSGAHFMLGGSFFGAIFKRKALFSKTVFDKYKTAFFNTAFYNTCLFSDIKISEELEFTAYLHETNVIAKFSISATADQYTFETAADSLLKIETEQITVADGRVFTIPLGCELFDPEPLPAPKPEEPTE